MGGSTAEDIMRIKYRSCANANLPRGDSSGNQNILTCDSQKSNGPLGSVALSPWGELQVDDKRHHTESGVLPEFNFDLSSTSETKIYYLNYHYLKIFL